MKKIIFYIPITLIIAVFLTGSLGARFGDVQYVGKYTTLKMEI